MTGSSNYQYGSFTSTASSSPCTTVRVRRVYFNSSNGTFSYGTYTYGYNHIVQQSTSGNVGATHGVYNTVDYPGGPFWQTYST